MASSSSTSAMPATPGLRKRRGQIPESDLVTSPSRVVVNSQDSAPLESEDLVALAHAWSRLERHILRGYDITARGQIENSGATVETSDSQTQEGLRVVETVLYDLNNVYNSTYHFAEGYLRDVALLRFWNFQVHLYRTRYNEDAKKHDPATVQQLLKGMGMDGREKESYAMLVVRPLKTALKNGSLDALTMNAIGDKYKCLDIVMSLHYENTGDPRKVPTWQSLMDEFDLPTSGVRNRPAASARNATRATSIELWILFLVYILSGFFTVIMATRNSAWERGNCPDDADFWFLLQGTIMQFSGVFISALRLVTNQRIPRLAWLLPCSAVAVLAILAPIFYCEWLKFASSVAILFATAMQAFLMLQLAIMGA